MAQSIFITNLSNNFKRLLQNLLSYPFSVTLSIILFFGIVFFAGTTRFGFNGIANRITSDLLKADAVRDSIVFEKSNTSQYTQALGNQYRYIKQYKNQHYRVGKIFEVYYYSMVLVLTLTSLVTTLLAVLIGRTGWVNQSPRIKAAFIGFFFCASLSGILINVFNSSKNASDNISKYFYFNNLQTNIYEGLAIDSVYNQSNRDSILYNIFINTNTHIKENMNLFLDIKADKIPTAPDINKIAGAPGPDP